MTNISYGEERKLGVARDNRAWEAWQEQRWQTGRRKAGARRPFLVIPQLAVRIRIRFAHSLEMPFCVIVIENL